MSRNRHWASAPRRSPAAALPHVDPDALGWPDRDAAPCSDNQRRPTIKQILIATDGSPGGREAVEQGLALASAAGANATIVYVRKPPHEFLGNAYYQRTLSGALAEAWQVIDNAVARATELDVDAEGEIMEGDAADQIISLARSRDVDLIIVGSRALGPIAGTLLGSVSRSVVHDADRPVLVVTPRAEERRAAA